MSKINLFQEVIDRTPEYVKLQIYLELKDLL